MCVLCGQDFVAQVHWTDRHLEDRARAAAPGSDPVAYQGDRRRDRAHRVVLTNEILRHYGLKLDDWGGSKYVLRDRKGRSEIVQDLGSLWPAAERLAGRAPDPLDPALRETLLDGQPLSVAGW
ncbi:MAG TPA: hypothetical protein VKA73_00365 [Rubrobacter sp.]|nr:hypothetical protein [Rubrobacter sp.]